MGMTGATDLLARICLVLALQAPVSRPAPAIGQGAAAGEPASGVRIEGAPPEADAARRTRLLAWSELYRQRLEPVRLSARALFAELERSSLAVLGARCRELGASVKRIDRRGLFASGDVELDRMLFGSLERYRAGAGKCLAGRYLEAYRLLIEARVGFEWVDRRVERSLRPPVPLRGLHPPS